MRISACLCGVVQVRLVGGIGVGVRGEEWFLGRRVAGMGRGQYLGVSMIIVVAAAAVEAMQRRSKREGESDSNAVQALAGGGVFQGARRESRNLQRAHCHHVVDAAPFYRVQINYAAIDFVLSIAHLQPPRTSVYPKSHAKQIQRHRVLMLHITPNRVK